MSTAKRLRQLISNGCVAMPGVRVLEHSWKLDQAENVSALMGSLEIKD
ncbi:MAG: hypothetical protein H0V56_07750 [Chthoniobacterales bacterium]|nr:hypothetical protein [Chthoniobacterales bacterium]